MSSLDVRSIDEKDLRNEPCPPTRHELRVFLSEAAFDRAVARGDSDTTREIGGVLVGELLRDEAGPYLRIDGTIDALHAEEKGAELTFTHATWDHIHKEMDREHQDKRVVGWYHTHPGFGIFLSDRDQFIHKSFFNLPFQVAFVYDPKSREHGMFTWHDNEVWRARRYFVGSREQVWDGPRASGDKPNDEHDRKLQKPGGDEREPKSAEARDEISLSGALGPLLLIGVVLLMIGGFVGHWIGVGSANQVLVTAQLEISKARAEGAQLTMASLQGDLVGILRDTLGDEALRRPIAQAIGDLDQAIAVLPVDSEAAPGPGSGAAPGPGSGDPRLLQLATELKATRASLLQLSKGRGVAQVVLAQLERATRPGSELRADLGHDVAEQRSGLGALYAELATDAVKSGDPGRARRLLAAAAHLDPGNRARYEKQLQLFDKAASLPHDTTYNSGSASQGSVR